MPPRKRGAPAASPSPAPSPSPSPSAGRGLEEELSRLRAAIESMREGFQVIGYDWRYLYLNAAAIRQARRPAGELLGRTMMQCYPGIEQTGMFEILARVMGHREPAALENEFVYPNAERAWFDLRIQPCAEGVSILSIDITERKRAEERFRQAQKMEAVGRLAGGVAHDFNNVLTAIFGYLDLMREDLPPDSPLLQEIADLRKAAERAAGLTRQLLAFSRQQVLEPVVLAVNELVEDLEKMLRRMIGEDVELRLAPGADVGNVRADPGQLQQVIMNLVVNARDAMPRGGKLIIETANADLTEQYAELHQPVVPGRYVMLAISDTGMGMAPEVKARMFEPFFTTKERGKGTGLGLSTVYGIVKQSGGYIWAYSEPGRGTSFKIYLPRVDEPVEGAARAKDSTTLMGSETILLAEDDALLRPLAKGLLEKLGYRVLEAADARDALRLAAAHAGPIQLLVADVVMPGASGRELARQLAATRPDIRTLYVSGYTDDAIVHHGMLEPGLNFLQKPFTPALLARKVREVLDAR